MWKTRYITHVGFSMCGRYTLLNDSHIDRTKTKNDNKKEGVIMYPVTRKYRLNSMGYAQCHVAITNDMNCDSVSIELISYSTSVCKIILSRSSVGKTAELFASGTYSVTTARHINRFTKEFCGCNLYHEVKKTCGAYGEYKKVCDINFNDAMSEAVQYMNGYSTRYYGSY